MKYYFLTFMVCFVLIYMSIFYIIQIPYSRNYYMNNFFSMCTLFSNPFQVARLYTKGPFSISYKDYHRDDCDTSKYMGTSPESYWDIIERPVIGDHVHLLYKVRVNNKNIIFHDRNLTETIAYESGPTACPSSLPYAYQKQWFHTGVHSHCDSPGIIHVHPWSAPIGLRKEGRDVTLGLFFESVGIERSTKGLGFKINGKYEKMNLAYYTNSKRTTGFLTQDETEIENLWLVDCHGIVLLWSDDSVMPDVGDDEIEFLKTFKCYPNNYPFR